MDEVKRLVKKHGAKVNVNFNKSELVFVITKRVPVTGLPTSSGFKTNRGKQIILNSIFSNSPGQGAKTLRAIKPIKIVGNGKSPSPRSANKKSASAGKRSRPVIR